MEPQSDSGGHRATVRELAAAFDESDFPIWDQQSLDKLPSNRQWADLANPYLVTVRISAAILTKQKDELLTLIRELEEGEVDGTPMIEDLVPRFHAAEEFFRSMLKTVEGAETRLLCAASKKAVLEDQPGLDDP